MAVHDSNIKKSDPQIFGPDFFDGISQGVKTNQDCGPRVIRNTILAIKPAAVMAAMMTLVRSAIGSTRTPSGEAMTTATGLEKVDRKSVG